MILEDWGYDVADPGRIGACGLALALAAKDTAANFWRCGLDVGTSLCDWRLGATADVEGVVEEIGMRHPNAPLPKPKLQCPTVPWPDLDHNWSDGRVAHFNYLLIRRLRRRSMSCTKVRIVRGPSRIHQQTILSLLMVLLKWP